MSWKLKRTKQCANCPWKVGVDPFDIPDGYQVEKHEHLACTIADPGSLLSNGHAMACHHSTEDNMQHCVGWVFQQITVGNNIRLRMQMMSCENIKDLKVVGAQHQRFEDTLPQ